MGSYEASSLFCSVERWLKNKDHWQRWRWYSFHCHFGYPFGLSSTNLQNIDIVK